VEQVLSKKQVCERANISDRTLDRETSAGRGPVHTQLGLRRWGVTVSDFDAWLASRRRVPPGWVDLPVTDDRVVPVDEADADARTEAHRSDAGARRIRTAVDAERARLKRAWPAPLARSRAAPGPRRKKKPPNEGGQKVRLPKPEPQAAAPPAGSRDPGAPPKQRRLEGEARRVEKVRKREEAGAPSA
jgi:predicted DNA-binding transcriptional regulator AlpA